MTPRVSSWIREQSKRISSKNKTKERTKNLRRHQQKSHTNHQKRQKRHSKEPGEEQHRVDDEDSDDSEDDDDDELFLSETTDTLGEQSLENLPLPTLNSFLVAAHLTKMKKGTDLQSSKAFVTLSGGIRMLILDKKVALTYAGETKFFDVDVAHEHEDDAHRQLCGALYVRYHYFTENMMAALVSTRHVGHTAGQELARNHIMKWTGRFQTPIMSTYHKGLKLLVKEMDWEVPDTDHEHLPQRPEAFSQGNGRENRLARGKHQSEDERVQTHLEFEQGGYDTKVRMNVFKRIWNSNKVAMAPK